MGAQEDERHECHDPMKLEDDIQPKWGLKPTQSRREHELQSKNGKGDDGAVHTNLDHRRMMGPGSEDRKQGKRRQDQQRVCGTQKNTPHGAGEPRGTVGLV